MLRSERQPWADIDVCNGELLNDPRLPDESWSSTNSQHSQSIVKKKKKKLVNKKLDVAPGTSSQGEDSQSESGGSSHSWAQGERTQSETTGTVCSTLDSEESDMSAFYDPVVAPNTEGMWSKGAILHDSGTCKPCLFVHNPVGCQNGVECEFCHLRHSRSSRPRPSKGKRDRIKRLTQVDDKEVEDAGNQAACKQGNQSPGKFSL